MENRQTGRRRGTNETMRHTSRPSSGRYLLLPSPLLWLLFAISEDKLEERIHRNRSGSMAEMYVRVVGSQKHFPIEEFAPGSEDGVEVGCLSLFESVVDGYYDMIQSK